MSSSLPTGTILPSQRHLFALPDDVTYLNCAYMSPLTRAMEDAGVAAVRAKFQPWNITPEDFFSVTRKVRASFAELVDAKRGDIALIPAASYGIATAARNLKVKPGQRILLLKDEFPSNVYSWQKLAAQNGGEVHFIPWPEDGDWTAALLSAMDERTAIVATPHCHWTDGSAVDLLQIGRRCKEVRAALVIDGTQSIGAYPIDIKAFDPDFVVTAGYKWMMGPYSYSYMYVAPRHQDGEPLEENWLSRKGAEDFTRLVDYQDAYQPGARRFDVGERSNFMLTPIALAALEQLLAWKVENIAATIGQLTEYVRQRAMALGFTAWDAAHRAPHMIGIRHPNLPPDLLKTLSAKKIYISQRGQSLRISPHIYNTKADIDRLFEGLETLIPA